MVGSSFDLQLTSVSQCSGNAVVLVIRWGTVVLFTPSNPNWPYKVGAVCFTCPKKVLVVVVVVVVVGCTGGLQLPCQERKMESIN